MDRISLRRFTGKDLKTGADGYIRALDAFDAIPQMRELKTIARERGGVRAGAAVLDVGCGFGLETLRLAEAAGASGAVAGIDIDEAFINVAKTRARAAGFEIDYQVGSAGALPWADSSFDCVRAERVLIYLDDPREAVREMIRVARDGGGLALIEPDFSTTDVNLPDRSLARRGLSYEIDTAVRQSCLPGALDGILKDAGLRDIMVDTRVAIMPPDLAAGYFSGIADRAAEAGALDTDEAAAWRSEIAKLAAADRLFGTVGYFAFTARV